MSDKRLAVQALPSILNRKYHVNTELLRSLETEFLESGRSAVQMWEELRNIRAIRTFTVDTSHLHIELRPLFYCWHEVHDMVIDALLRYLGWTRDDTIILLPEPFCPMNSHVNPHGKPLT